jgi:hypothetical protein
MDILGAASVSMDISWKEQSARGLSKRLACESTGKHNTQIGKSIYGPN